MQCMRGLKRQRHCDGVMAQPRRVRGKRAACSHWPRESSGRRLLLAAMCAHHRLVRVRRQSVHFWCCSTMHVTSDTCLNGPCVSHFGATKNDQYDHPMTRADGSLQMLSGNSVVCRQCMLSPLEWMPLLPLHTHSPAAHAAALLCCCAPLRTAPASPPPSLPRRLRRLRPPATEEPQRRPLPGPRLLH